MKTNKNFAVRVYDTTCNDYNHESGIYYDYSWADETITDNNSEYKLTKEEAEKLMNDFQEYAAEHGLDWATFEVEEFPLTYDVQFDDDNNSNSEGWHESLQACKDYIESYNGTNESYFEDYKGGVASIVCNETGETVYEEIIK